MMTDTAALLGTWNMTSGKREIVATGEKIDARGPESGSDTSTMDPTVAFMRWSSADIACDQQLFRQATVRN